MRIKLAYFLIPLYTVLVSKLGSIFVKAGKDPWYKILNLPWYTPPDWLFGVAWSFIFLTATCSALLIYHHVKNRTTRITLMYLFFLNGLLNALWTLLFFYNHQIGWGLTEAIALELTVISIIIIAWKAGQKGASLLMTPYALWMFFALILNAHIWFMN